MIKAANTEACSCYVFDNGFSAVPFVSLSCQAYVFEGDIYYQSGVTSNPVRLTSTGQEPQVVNGLSDWTYEGRKLSPEAF